MVHGSKTRHMSYKFGVMVQCSKYTNKHSCKAYTHFICGTPVIEYSKI